MAHKIQSTVCLSIAFVFLWNFGFIAAEQSLNYSGPFTLLFWRYWMLTFVLLGYLFIRGRMKWPGRSAAALASLVGILSHGVWLSCGLLSMAHGVPVGIVALIVALQPMATGALSGIATGEPIPINRWIGLAVGFSGIVIAVYPRIDPGDTAFVSAYLMPFGSVAAITIASLIQRRLEIKNMTYRLPVDLALFYQSLATALGVTIPAIFIENLATEWEPLFWVSMLWLVFGVSLAAYGLMWMLIARIDATRVASLFYLGPPITMLLAWAVFGDRIHQMDLAGVIVVVIGVWLTQGGRFVKTMGERCGSKL